ncbi:MAG: SigB/SigF/SigG family RNA polymerase sigma factor [Acidaminococcus sp.]|nr:SigB/SigF/SigG family RNA polymerase sigma factor [Acidaminococcus sp.]
MLEHNQTVELIKKAQNGDSNAKDELINNNLPLIKSVVKRFTGRLEYDDLMQLGSMGFLKAVSNFDEAFGVRFSTYAVPMIMGEIKRFLRDDGMIKVSRSMKTLNYKINVFVEEYKSEHQKEPTINEIADKLNEDPHDVVFAMDSAKTVTSIYAESDDGEMNVLDKIADDSELNMFDKLLIKDSIQKLSGREQKIIILRYFRDKTQSEVAELLGISQVQVSRLENKILMKLKDNINGSA